MTLTPTQAIHLAQLGCGVVIITLLLILAALALSTVDPGRGGR